MIRVLIADDHTVVRGGLVALLEDVEGMEVVAEAADGQEAILKSRLVKPDVILMDLAMPRKTGIEAIEEIMHESPNARIVVLTSYADDEKIFAAIQAGAMGYLLKETSTEVLLAGIRLAHQGLAWLPPALARRLIRELNRPTTLPPTDEPLTEREAEVLILVARGLAVADIAGKLLMPEQAVYRHIANILTKLRQSSGPHNPLEPPLPLPIPVR
jgi:two-component system, NarL family, response regulator LiaR